MSAEASNYCHDCGVVATTKYVAFYQNIGALVMRFTKSVDGYFCKSCINKHFWPMTGITFLLGWWGTISFIMTPFILLNNFFRYLFCLGMPSVPEGATYMRMSAEVWDQIEPYGQEIFRRIGAGEDAYAVVSDVSKRSGIPTPLIGIFVQEILKQHQQQQQ